MTNEEILLAIKDIRNIFDTAETECFLSSRFAIDTWAQILQGGGNAELVNFVQTVLHKVSALRGLLYSIDVKTKKLKEDALGGRVDEPIELKEQENADN